MDGDHALGSVPHDGATSVGPVTREADQAPVDHSLEAVTALAHCMVSGTAGGDDGSDGGTGDSNGGGCGGEATGGVRVVHRAHAALERGDDLVGRGRGRGCGRRQSGSVADVDGRWSRRSGVGGRWSRRDEVGTHYEGQLSRKTGTFSSDKIFAVLVYGDSNLYITDLKNVMVNGR